MSDKCYNRKSLISEGLYENKNSQKEHIFYDFFSGDWGFFPEAAVMLK